MMDKLPERTMRDELIILWPGQEKPAREERLRQILAFALSAEGDPALDPALPEEDSSGIQPRFIRDEKELDRYLRSERQLKGCRLLFAVSIGDTGINVGMYAMLEKIREMPHCMDGSAGAILVDGESELFTKSAARQIAFSMNFSGCLLIGRPLVEGTGSLKNFLVTASVKKITCREAYGQGARDLLSRLLTFHEGKADPLDPPPKLLTVHASSRKTSNTLRLWEMVERNLDPSIRREEIALQNGSIKDCIGCHYSTCMYYGNRSGCYFGGTMVEEVYPALRECDALVLLCPNYNDAAGANLSAMINRLTALFRTTPFYDKYLFAVIVSGYSGGDLVAGQLIGALNMNKAFILPPRFALMEIANDANSILRTEGIEQKAFDFAQRINQTLKRESFPLPSE